MSYEFQCPQGHLLAGDPAQAGQQCQCPLCGTMFIMPDPPGQAAPPPGPFPAPPSQPFPGGFAPNPQGSAAPFSPFQQEAAPQLLHIPCPQGHELEVPPEMLNQDVLCPHCSVQFRLREKDSVEYKRKMQAEIDRRDQKIGKLWFNWAIAIAVIVLIGLAIMIAVANS